MSANVSPVAPNGSPILRQMKKMASRLGSLADSHDSQILSRRESTNATPNVTPNRAASSALQPRRPSPPPLNPSDLSAEASRSSAEEHNTPQHTPTLHRRHGRLVVSPQDLHLLPQALPTENFYGRFPRAVGPVANVVVTTPAEHRRVLATCDPVTVTKTPKKRDVAKLVLCKEDVDHGGFFVYMAPKSKTPQYYKPRDAAADEYGTSSYIRL